MLKTEYFDLINFYLKNYKFKSFVDKAKEDYTNTLCVK